MSNVLTPQIPTTPATPGPPTPPADMTPPHPPAVVNPPPNPWRGGTPPAPTATPPAAFSGGFRGLPPAAQFGPGQVRPGFPGSPPPAPPPPTPTGNTFGLPFQVPQSAADVQRMFPQLYDGVAASRFGSTTVPPLIGAGVTEGLPDAVRGPAEGALRFAQRNLQNNPALFAQLVGGLGGSLVSPLLGTPAGLPLMAGLYGTLAGGEAGQATERFFRPVIDRFRSSPAPQPQ